MTINEWEDISNNYETLIEIGLIAQDIKKIPLFKDTFTYEECDSCGNINILALNYNDILTTSISALQEVYKQFIIEKDKNILLEKRISMLENT